MVAPELARAIEFLSKTGYHVLVAEDSESNLALIELYFRQTACRLRFAKDGGEAVRLFESERFDLVLMDVQMPVMNGHEATRRIRKIEAERGDEPVPIVAVTANDFADDEALCLTVGCTGFLLKPFLKADLLTCVARQLGDSS